MEVKMKDYPMPDDSITIAEMQDYGYDWEGMLPMRQEVAAKIMKYCTIYRLYNDNTEGMVEYEYELQEHEEHGGIFGIEEDDWLAVLRKEINNG